MKGATRDPRDVRGDETRVNAPALGGVPLVRVLPALRSLEPEARACWCYDLDALDARARRFVAAFRAIDPLVAFALKANALPALLARASAAGLAAESGSTGELELARRAGFESARRVLNGNGRTPEEAAWAAREGVALVNADHAGELDLLEREAARTARTLRVALRVNPGIATPGHRYIATGGEDAKFGMSAAEALEAWSARARWPHLSVDGVHFHIGSQLVDLALLERELEFALELAAEAAHRGSPLALVNLGGGFGVDYGSGAEFPLEAWGARLGERVRALGFEWVLEPGRWMVAPVGVLLAEVLWIKRRAGRRFVVLAAGMNDLLRPALYHAVHRIVPVTPRAGAPERATVVGPVCESADVFVEDIELPPLEAGDVVALLDAGAYGAVMSSNYNGRGRLAEVVASEGRLVRARAGETPEDLTRRDRKDELEAE
jgi:diaminopimelate decarboxylase